MLPSAVQFPEIIGDFTPDKGLNLRVQFTRVITDLPGDHHAWIGPLDNRGKGVRIGLGGVLISPLVALCRCLLPPLPLGFHYETTCTYTGCCNISHAVQAPILRRVGSRPLPNVDLGPGKFRNAKRVSSDEWRRR